MKLHTTADELRACHALRRLAAMNVARFLGEHDFVGAVAVVDPPGSQPAGERPFHAAATEQVVVANNGLWEQHGRQACRGQECATVHLEVPC